MYVYINLCISRNRSTSLPSTPERHMRAHTYGRRWIDYLIHKCTYTLLKRSHESSSLPPIPLRPCTNLPRLGTARLTRAIGSTVTSRTGHSIIEPYNNSYEYRAHAWR